MKIQEDTYVSLAYTLRLDSGEVVDQATADEPLGFIFNSGMIISGLERQIAGMELGQSAKVTVEADEGYGQVRQELVFELPRGNFPPDAKLELGVEFSAEGPRGVTRFRVKQVNGDSVLADFNHPLAGKRLHFDVEVTGVREATDEDRAEASCGCSDEDCGEGCGGCGGECH